MGRSSSSTRTTTNTDNRQLAVQDGIGAFSEGDTNITVSDFGAIDRSLASVDNSVNKALSTVDSTTDTAFEFGQRVQNEVSNTARDAFGLVREGFAKVQELASQSVRGESGEVADVNKAVIYAGAGVSALFILYLIFRGRK